MLPEDVDVCVGDTETVVEGVLVELQLKLPVPLAVLLPVAVAVELLVALADCEAVTVGLPDIGAVKLPDIDELLLAELVLVSDDDADGLLLTLPLVVALPVTDADIDFEAVLEPDIDFDAVLLSVAVEDPVSVEDIDSGNRREKSGIQEGN